MEEPFNEVVKYTECPFCKKSAIQRKVPVNSMSGLQIMKRRKEKSRQENLKTKSN